MDDTASTLRELRVKWKTYKRGEPRLRSIFPLEASKYICGKSPFFLKQKSPHDFCITQVLQDDRSIKRSESDAIALRSLGLLLFLFSFWRPSSEEAWARRSHMEENHSTPVNSPSQLPDLHMRPYRASQLADLLTGCKHRSEPRQAHAQQERAVPA